MVRSAATTVPEYLASLPPDRRAELEQVRQASRTPQQKRKPAKAKAKARK